VEAASDGTTAEGRSLQVSLVRKSMFNMLGTIFMQGLAALIGIVLARLLGPDGIGQYQLALTSSMLLTTFLASGVGQAMIFSLNNLKADPSVVISTGGSYAVITGSLIAIVVYYILHFPYFGALSEIAIIAVSLHTLALSVIMVLAQYFIAKLEIKKNIVLMTLPKVLILSMVTAGIFLWNVDVTFALAAQAVGYLGGLVALVYLLRKVIHIKPPSLSILKTMLQLGAGFSFSILIYMLDINIALMLIRFFLDDFSLIGYYGRAVAVAGMLLFIPKSIGPLLYSKWSGVSTDQRKHQVELATRLLLLLGIAISLVLILGAKWIIILMYTKEFMRSVLPLRILILAVFCRFLMSPLNQLFASVGKPFFMGLTVFIGLLIMVIFMLFLIPYYSVEGAAISVLAGNIASLVFGFALARQKYQISISRCFQITSNDLLLLWRNVMVRSS